MNNNVEIWFLSPLEGCSLSYAVNMAIKQHGDETNITHVVLKPTDSLIFDMTIDGVYLTDEVEDFEKRLVAKVTLKYKNPLVIQTKIMDYIEELLNNEEKLDANTFVNWYMHRNIKGGKFCTDYIVDLLELNGFAPNNALPSYMLSWFMNEQIQLGLKEFYNIDEITIEKVTEHAELCKTFPLPKVR